MWAPFYFHMWVVWIQYRRMLEGCLPRVLLIHEIFGCDILWHEKRISSGIKQCNIKWKHEWDCNSSNVQANLSFRNDFSHAYIALLAGIRYISNKWFLAEFSGLIQHYLEICHLLQRLNICQEILFLNKESFFESHRNEYFKLWWMNNITKIGKVIFPIHGNFGRFLFLDRKQFGLIQCPKKYPLKINQLMNTCTEFWSRRKF